ncbi:MAG: TonB-dependent receptor [Acidobacteriia bacterium]|nr:TonB-dependent receptor [Terriglobia bacterium]
MRGHGSSIYLLCLFLISLTSGLPAQTAPPQGSQSTPAASTPFGEISGIVKSGNTPLPGVTVSASNTLTGKKYTTSTDIDGSFRIEVGSKGRYVVRAEFLAFAPVTQEVLMNAENRSAKAELSMVLLSRVQQQEAQQQRQAQLAAAGRPGLQQLALSGGDLGDAAMSGGGGASDAASLAGSGLPNAGLAAEGSTESVAVSGAMGRSDQPTFDPGEMQDRIAELRDQMARQGGGNAVFQGGAGGPGGFGGGAGGPMIIMMGGGPGGGGRGGFRNFNVNKPHGSIFYNFGGSPLDARPYALSGVPADKADYSQNRFGITLGGPLNIPHIYHGGTKTFLFGSYIGARATNPFDVFSTVPTLAERSGNFSGSSSTIFDPATHTPFLNNTLPSINPAAAAVLNFIPVPNLPGDRRNFHFVSANRSNTDIVFARFNHSFGNNQNGMMGLFGGGARQQQRQQQRRQQSGDQKKIEAHWSHSINGGINFSNFRSNLLNPFPDLGGKSTAHNLNTNFGYNLSRGVFLNSLRFNYNRSHNETANNFTNSNNISAQLGISGVSPSPSDFGLPNFNFSPEFSNLQDTSARTRTDQTYTISDSMNWTHGKHGWSWGFDFRHQLLDLSNAANARGTFVFTGLATGLVTTNAQGQQVLTPGTGLPFADFLLGFPQQTSIQFGASNYQFRANSWDLFVQDNWRVAKNVTLNLGLRYEYVSPFTELHGKLVNLDIAPGFSAVAPVLPGQIGPFSGERTPDGLMHPDRNNFAPRVGIAWKPFSRTVVRTGYGMNYNLGQYSAMATQLGFQPPFAFTQTNTVQPGNPLTLTLQNGFPAASAPVTNSYAVDPNYRLAYVQTWNLNIQQDLKHDLIMNIGYSGSRGTHLDIVRAPSLDASGVPINGAQPFLFESSNGSSILHSGSLRVRKRMRHGLSLGGAYTYSKSIDNASSIGGSSVLVAQNDLDLAAERGLSSFDQRHRFAADYSYELPFGKEKKWMNGNNWAARAVGGFTFSGNMTIASGFPFSPRIFNTSSDLNRGVNGTLRPDIVPGATIASSDPSILHWFNTAAFTAPAGAFGNAGRNIIIGPGNVDFSMAVARNIQIKDMQNLELRLSATNIFNTAHFTTIDATLGSPTFGQVTGAGSMRKAQIIARYRF